jgi:hypothetical protein
MLSYQECLIEYTTMMNSCHLFDAEQFTEVSTTSQKLLVQELGSFKGK